LAPQSTNKRSWILLPVIGTILFIVLYIIAAFLYPGGSQADAKSKGFSWINNYWCNLLNKTAINGETNLGRPVALTASFILCITLSSFWYHFPRHIKFGKYSRLTIQFSGAAAMVFSIFLFTNMHDTVTNIAGLFGVIALTGTLIGLYKNNWYGLFWFGIFNLLLVVLNNYIYYNKGLIIYLPVIQKISFLSFLLWICGITVNLYNTQSSAKTDS
jgi:hypothetical protein